MESCDLEGRRGAESKRRIEGEGQTRRREGKKMEDETFRS